MQTGAAMSTPAYSLRALLLAGSTITATSLALEYAAQLLAVCWWPAGYMHNLRSLALFILGTLRRRCPTECASLMRVFSAPHVNALHILSRVAWHLRVVCGLFANARSTLCLLRAVCWPGRGYSALSVGKRHAY